MNKEDFNELLDQLIVQDPEGVRYCILRKFPYPIKKLTDFDCFDCKLFVGNPNSDDPNAICDPL